MSTNPRVRSNAQRQGLGESENVDNQLFPVGTMRAHLEYLLLSFFSVTLLLGSSLFEKAAPHGRLLALQNLAAVGRGKVRLMVSWSSSTPASIGSQHLELVDVSVRGFSPSESVRISEAMDDCPF